MKRKLVPLLVASLFALSLGLASGMWAVIDAVAIRPLPYPDAEQLVAVMETHPVRGKMSVTPANFLDWTDVVSTLQATAGFRFTCMSNALGPPHLSTIVGSRADADEYQAGSAFNDCGGRDLFLRDRWMSIRPTN